MKFLFATLSCLCSFCALGANEQIDEQLDSPSQDLSSFLSEQFETQLSLSELPFALQTEEQTQITLTDSDPELLDAHYALPAAQEESFVQSAQTPLEEFSSEEEAPLIAVQEKPLLVANPTEAISTALQVDLKQAFRGSPAIYSILFSLSVFSVGLFLYLISSIQALARTPSSVSKQLKNTLTGNNFEGALELCHEKNSLLSKMVEAGIESRTHGLPNIVESMKLEAKRSTVFFWQKIGLLNDIAVIAPMLGLLGTVLGMFYAFYDVNRSIESISSLFDGLGVSVGTTVAGLVVAILALILHSAAKYRLVRSLAKVENEAQSLARLLDDKTHIQQG